jgi:hypothetical protein
MLNIGGRLDAAKEFGRKYQDFFKDSANSGYPCLNEVAV